MRSRPRAPASSSPRALRRCWSKPPARSGASTTPRSPPIPPTSPLPPSARACIGPFPTRTSSSTTPAPFPAAASPTSPRALAAGLAPQGVRLHPSVPALPRRHEGAQVGHHRQHHRHGRTLGAARLHLRGGRQWRPDALGAETPGYNVRVFGINPAATMTDRIVEVSKVRAKARFGDESRWEEVLNAAKLPFGRIKSADEVAALATMLASAKVHYLSGIVIDMDGGGQWHNA